MIYADANIIIRLLEGNPAARAPIEARLSAFQGSRRFLVTSRLTRLECRVKPLATKDGELLALYEAFFSSPEVQLLVLSPWNGISSLPCWGTLPCGVSLSLFQCCHPAKASLDPDIRHIDSHFRIGGAAGTELQVANCPRLSGAVKPACIAGSLLLHLTKTSSAYLENIWVWTADHDLDDKPSLSEAQVDIYVARGKPCNQPAHPASMPAHERCH